MGKSTMIQALLLLRQAQEQNALDKGIYLNGKYTNIGVGKDLLYTNAQENCIHISLESETGVFKKSYRYEGEADFLREISGEDGYQISGLNLFGKECD